MELKKHASVFNPLSVRGTVVVVGVGALGSALALQLAKLGLENLLLFDDDIVEAHNIPNQIVYGPATIGWPKVQAAQSMIEILTGYQPEIARAKLVERHQLPAGDIWLCVAVDSMAVRKHIFDRLVWVNPNIKFYVEGRMNSREGSIHTFAAADLEAAKVYKEHMLYPDSEVTVDRGACGNILSIGATATALACEMTWALINAANGRQPWQALEMDVAGGAVPYRGALR